jgi:hypothetical protein
MDFVTVSHAATPAEAELVRSRLEANGFAVNLKSENAAMSFGGGLILGGIQVQVQETEAQNARALLESPPEPNS